MTSAPEGDVASGDGVPGPPGPTATPPSPAMTSAPVDAAASPSSVAELEVLAKKQRLMLDKAYRYLLDQGFGLPELASLDLGEVPAMARQLADPHGGLARGGAVLLAARSAAGS